MADLFDDVLHITNDPALAEHIDALGGGCLVVPDILSMGPLHLDPKKHRKKRLAWWREVIEATSPKDHVSESLELLEEAPLSPEQLGSAISRHVKSGRRAVIWTSPAWADRLLMWFVFHATREAGIDHGRLATAELRRRDEDDTRWLTVAEAEDEDVDTAWEDLFYPVALYVETCASLWQTFVTGSPRQLALSVPHTEKFFPDLPESFEDHGRLFPQVRGPRSKVVRLSEFDHALLSALVADAPQPFDLDALPDAFDAIDLRYIFHRISQWVAFDDDPLVVKEEGAEGPGLLLTERGRRVLDEGFTGPADAPVLHAGNARMYAGKKPWVRIVERKAWWFERFGAERG